MPWNLPRQKTADLPGGLSVAVVRVVVARVSGDDGPGPGTSVRLYISGYDEYTADWSSNPWTPGVGWTSGMFWVAENSVGPIFSNWNEKVGFGEIRFWDYALTDAEFEAERDRLEAKWKV